MINLDKNIAKTIGYSLYLQREFNRNPEVFKNKNMKFCYQNKELKDSIYENLLESNELSELNKKLRNIRNTEMVRIALRDLTGQAEVVETIRDLSDLAEGLVAGALEWHYKLACIKFGVPMGEDSKQPQKLLVIAMGKLGGKELNFSSDIDLIFTYPEKGYATNEKGKQTDNEQFFIRLGQAVNKSLTEVTADGFVYRVDMRLRPFGNTGPLAVSFNEVENYYAMHGRAWERYALVKARVIAGDEDKGRELFDILRPFVYRKYIDFSSLDSLRELKTMIHAEVVKKEMHDNIKLGRGGIREIEFIIQVFQLINGGRDKNLQSQSLLKTLQVCTKNNYLSEQESSSLKSAYIFLRKAENRIQEWNDQQIHDLPKNEQQQQVLATTMGYEDYSQFNVVLEEHRQFVQQQFDLVFAEDSVDEHTFVIPSLLEQQSFSDIENGYKEIESFRKSAIYSRAGKESIDRFEQVLPKVIMEITKKGNQLETLQRILSLFESVLQRSVYLVLLIENKAAITNLVLLCSMSQWLTDRLVRSPVLFDQLLDGEILFNPLEANTLNQEAELIRKENQADDEKFMNQLREWRSAQIFKVAASDVTGHLPVMKVSDYLTWIAEAVLKSVSEYSWQLMLSKNGQPHGIEPKERPLLVLAYGKLGGIELGYGSDLDIVFLYCGLQGQEKTSGINVEGGGKKIDNGLFMTRMVQKIISLMTTIMPTGILYEIDTRLRPSGSSGLIISDFDSFVAYQKNKAWTWEHQALVRARPVVFDKKDEKTFYEFKESFIKQTRNIKTIKNDVIEMRQKMRDALDKSTIDKFDLKQGKGGIVDIEFIVQYLVLAYASKYKELAKYADNLRLLEEIKKLNFLEQVKAKEIEHLANAYCHYRSMYHQLALGNKSSTINYKEVEAEIIVVKELWNKVF